MTSSLPVTSRVFAAPPIPDTLSFGLKSAAQSLQNCMKGKKILIVDDDPVVLTALSMKLKGLGCETITASDGSAAVSAVRKGRPDLILLDITFPPDVAHGGGVAWDGFLIMSWLKRMEEAKNIPIIIVTGGEEVKYKDRSLAAGAVAFFHK